MERVFSGDTRTEWTVGVDLGRGASSVSARVIAGQQAEGTLDVRRRVGANAILELGFASYDWRNLNGARRISRLESGDRQNQLHVAVSWAFR